MQLARLSQGPVAVYYYLGKFQREFGMKRRLLALTVLASVAASSNAQSNVTVYGIVDMGIRHENNGAAAGSVTRLDSGVMSGSRIGFRGVENLGNGLSAIFQLENGFNADDGTLAQGGRFFGRQSWVGLAGGFGTVKLGRQVTPVFANSGVFDPFGDTQAGDSARLFNYSGSRTDNVVSYSKELSGLRGELQYGFGEVAGDTSANRMLGAVAGYRAGPIDVVLTYTGNNNAAGSVRGKTTLIGGNYNFGFAKLFAAYAWNKDVTPTGVVTAGADTRNALIGATAPLGSGTLRFSYIRLMDEARSNADANQIAIGYVYDLSKRTALHTSASRLENDGGANYRAARPGASVRTIDVGIRHSF